MSTDEQDRELAFAISDVARLLRTYADQQACRLGLNRAKWAVLSRLERSEGIRQNELADLLDLQPISLTRLLDGLCESGLIERRPDPDDRRAKRLYLTPAAHPVLAGLRSLSRELMANALCGLEPTRRASMLAGLSLVKCNLRNAIHQKQLVPEDVHD